MTPGARREPGRKNFAGRFTSRIRRTYDWFRDRPRLTLGFGLGVLAFVTLSAGIGIGTWNAVCRDCPSIAAIYNWEPKSATQILDRNGALIAELYLERRTPVKLSTLPPYVPQAFVAIEDKRFYQHHGLDWRRIIGANLRNLLTGHRLVGGSTFTTQLARWMFTDQIGFERRITRKIKEARVAKELERVYSKEQILEAYINQVNYGKGQYGIEAASQYFFGKSAIDLNPAEAALLAAVINRPADYSPIDHPDRALARRNLDLRLMADQGYLTRPDAERWMKEPLPTEPARVDEGKVAPYFVEWVRDQLDDRFGDDLYSRGFRVTTTLDLGMQRAAKVAMDSGWTRIESLAGYSHPKYADVMADSGSQGAAQTKYLQGMFIAVDPASGEIRALIGGRDFSDSKFNRAIQALRQPGSTFKPITYLSAIANGIPASHVIYDSPVMIPQFDSTMYSPKNYNPEFKGPLTLRDALRWSVNTVAVKLGVEVGLETISQMAHSMGITTEVPPYNSTPIGAPSVYPIEMVEAYTVFANTGERVAPRPILKVEDAEGRVLWETFSEHQTVVDSAAAAIVRDMMRTVIDQGSGVNARAQPWGLPYEVPAAGKTGTTNDATDVWFIGFTPDILAAVWYGFDLPTKIYPNAAGGGLAAPVWGQFMHSLYYADSAAFAIPEPWPWPSNVTTRMVDRETGDLASSWCPEDRMYEEHYIPGTEPTEVCRPEQGIFTGPLRPRFGSRRDTMAIDTLDGRGRRLPPGFRRDTLAGPMTGPVRRRRF